MRLKAYCVCVAMVLLLSGCGGAPEPAPVPEPAPEPEVAEPAGSADPLSGTWTGDWGPAPDDRNAVVLDLTWDGTALGGTVNPGPDAVELMNAAFDPATNTLTMEADAESFRGPVHYMIEGALDGNTISGSWGHDDVTGDFTIMMGSAEEVEEGAEEAAGEMPEGD